MPVVRVTNLHDEDLYKDFSMDGSNEARARLATFMIGALERGDKLRAENLEHHLYVCPKCYKMTSTRKPCHVLIADDGLTKAQEVLRKILGDGND